VLGRKGSVVLPGGPNFIAHVEHRLRAYTNVVHRYEVRLVLEVFASPELPALRSSRRGCIREAVGSMAGSR